MTSSDRGVELFADFDLSETAEIHGCAGEKQHAYGRFASLLVRVCGIQSAE